MTDTVPDLTESPYSLASLLNTAVVDKLRLKIGTVDGTAIIGTPVQLWNGDGALVTITDGDQVWFVPLAHITHLTPQPESETGPVAFFA